jgi:hypothetical protein
MHSQKTSKQTYAAIKQPKNPLKAACKEALFLQAIEK